MPPIDSSLFPLAGLFVLLLAGIVLRRVPVIGTALALASWGALLVALWLAFDQRARFDPEFGRVTGLFRPDRQQVVGGETRIAMAPDGISGSARSWATGSSGGCWWTAARRSPRCPNAPPPRPG